MINQVKLWFLNIPKNHVFSILLEQKDKQQEDVFHTCFILWLIQTISKWKKCLKLFGHYWLDVRATINVRPVELLDIQCVHWLLLLR